MYGPSGKFVIPGFCFYIKINTSRFLWFFPTFLVSWGDYRWVTSPPPPPKSTCCGLQVFPPPLQLSSKKRSSSASPGSCWLKTLLLPPRKVPRHSKSQVTLPLSLETSVAGTLRYLSKIWHTTDTRKNTSRGLAQHVAEIPRNTLQEPPTRCWDPRRHVAETLRYRLLKTIIARFS